MRRGHLSDAELIRASLETPEVFEGLFDRHHDSVYRFLVVRVGHSDAGDLASEVFTRAFAGRHRYNPEITSARPWLYGIAANLARHRARSLRYHAQKLQRIRGANSQAALDRTDEASDRVEASMSWPRLAVALAELTVQEREVVGLHLVAELTQAETAAALGIPEGTVKSRLSRARRKLGERLDDLGESKPRGSQGDEDAES